MEVTLPQVNSQNLLLHKPVNTLSFEGHNFKDEFTKIRASESLHRHH